MTRRARRAVTGLVASGVVAAGLMVVAPAPTAQACADEVCGTFCDAYNTAGQAVSDATGAQIRLRRCALR